MEVGDPDRLGASSKQDDDDSNKPKNVGAEQPGEEEANAKGGIGIKKRPFQLKDDAKLITVHHIIREQDALVRIKVGVCCFNGCGTQLALIDRRGNAFVFDFVEKRYWRHPQLLAKATVIVASVQRSTEYLVGTKYGSLLLLDVEQPQILKSLQLSADAVNEISFSGICVEPKHFALVRTGQAALVVDLDTFTIGFRLEFDNVLISLKFASYLWNSEHIFTCFTNNTVHIWSCKTLKQLRVINPLKARDRKLRLQVGPDATPEFTLQTPDNNNQFQLSCAERNYSNGLIVAYSYQSDGNLLCLSTMDSYLLMLSCYTYELQNVYRLRSFFLQQCALLPKPKDMLVLGLTGCGKVVLLDCNNTEFKLVVDVGPGRLFSTTNDGKLLAIVAAMGEISIWSNCRLVDTVRSQEQCMDILRSAFKQKKPLGMPSYDGDDRFQEELRKMLTPERLRKILQEFHCYPAKYRTLIWCSLLHLPNNKSQYQDLLQMGNSEPVIAQARRLDLKDAALKRTLVKCWSCLAHWCKMFAYAEQLLHLIFPFVKLFRQNSLVAFELCATLLSNHFQLFFEYHPLEPANYLGLCTNILQHFDKPLTDYYAEKGVTASDYAWSLLANTMAEVLDEEQWLSLWDNVLSAPPYYLVFCVVAYNVLQREVILRLPDKETIVQFFHEQNPLDINKLIAKAFKLLAKCPDTLHPKRYIKDFQPLPKGVYPKFLNYPRKCLTQYEQKVEDLKKEHSELDSRMRQLELEELEIMRRLENGLRKEEHTKRMKELEKHYQNALKREEERIACQRKMLLVYQKEIRSRKGQVVAALQESTRRKTELQKERELNSLQDQIERERIRNDVNLMWAEEELRNHDMELMAQKSITNNEKLPLKAKFYKEIKKLCEEQQLLSDSLKEISKEFSKAGDSNSLNNLDEVERKVDELQKEFLSLVQTNDR